MANNFIELTEDEFDAQYPLRPNHLNPSAGWAQGDAGGCLFETQGEEFAFVKRQDPRTVWTLLDGEDGDMYLVNGLHFVNRIGYLLSTIPTPDNVTIQVHLPMSKDDALPKADASNTNIDAILASRREIASTWSVEDVQQVRPDLNDDQAWQVLQYVDRHFDSSIGINWDTLESAARELFGKVPDEEGE